MAAKQIQITETDFDKLRDLIDRIALSGKDKKRNLDSLQKEVMRARIVKPEHISRDVITMNSTVRLRDLDSGEAIKCTLVYPEEADITQNRISILAPVGTGILGYSVGDVVEWKVPAGIRRLKVEKILYQPEASGDYRVR